MHYGQEIPMLGSTWAYLYFVENPGMAFGYTLKGENGKLILSLFRIVAIGILFFYLRRLIQAGASTGVLVSFALILTGAIGNVVDSMFYGLIFSASPFHSGEAATFVPLGAGYAPFLHGRVVDMFFFPIWQGIYPEWIPYLGGQPFQFFKPVFNIADVAISLGVITLLFQRHQLQPLAANGTPAITEHADIEKDVDAEGSSGINSDSSPDNAPKEGDATAR